MCRYVDPVDWTAAVDAYCERTDASFWSEPLNALSNAAFLVAALVGWRMARRAGDPSALILAAGAAVIGVGSFLFHTVATAWSLQADVIPIRVFVIVYVGLAAVRFFRAPWWVGLIVMAAFVPFSIIVVHLARAVLGSLNGSVGYLPVPLLMVIVGIAIGRRLPTTSRAILGTAVLFTVSLVLRTVDPALCDAWPLGTHFLWHALNAMVIGWMIHAYVTARQAHVPDRSGPDSPPSSPR